MISLLSWFALSPPAIQEPFVCPAAQAAAADGQEKIQYVNGLNGFVFRRTPDLVAPNLAGKARIDLLTTFVRVLEGLGTTLVLAPLPPRGMLHGEQIDRSDPIGATFDPVAQRKGWEAALNQLRQSGARVADMTKVPVQGNFYFKADTHWTDVGAQAGAQAVAAEIADLHIARRVFTSSVSGTFNSPNIIARNVAEACGRPAPVRETAPRSVTTAPPAGLLDELPNEVLLVGTSNSNLGQRDEANFSGRLQEETGLAVLNFSVIGGGASSGMRSALEARELWQHPPSVLVWENSPNGPYTIASDLRQFIAMLEPPCTADRAVAEATGLTDGQPILQLPAERGIHGQGWFVHVESDPALLNFNIEIQDWAKGSERTMINRLNRTVQTGMTDLLLSPTSTAPVRSIAVSARKGDAASMPVTVRICPTTSKALREGTVAQGSSTHPAAR